MKIVIFENDTVTKGDVDLSVLEKLGDVEFFGFSQGRELIERIGDAQAVFVNKSPMTAEVIKSCPDLKYVGLFSTGFNNIDLSCASKHNITVTNVPAYSTDAVAQHVFAYILNHFSRVSEYAKTVFDGDWIRSRSFCYFHLPTYEIRGLTLGIIGFGSIGKKVSKIAAAFDMNVIVHTRTAPKSTENIELVSLEELFRRADVVTVHCPLNEQTRHMINAKTLSLMKKSAYLINTSRGGTVDEQALADALNSEIIGGAGLDVVDVEPMLENNPLRLAKNCTITPHIAWAPKQTRQRLVNIAAENFISWENGRIINAVN
ncbi:MAG: D-2-hydroxyacid dehydrogenase [Oscillospiraceae bacterium]|jgi:glycerate dehydrogenase